MTNETRRIAIAALSGVLNYSDPASWPSIMANVQQALHVLHSDTADPAAGLRKDFFDRLSYGPTICETCTRRAMIYQHSVCGGLARSLHKLYTLRRAAHLSEFKVLSGGGLLCVLRHHQLIARPAGDRSRSVNRSGRWVITQRGVDWIEGRITIPQFVWTYADRPLQFSEEQISFSDAMASTWTPQQRLQGVTA